ncbi:MAG: 1-acyl-sn-glycerol-3-phosphate acyltransferase [Bacteroidales bacterium]|nr:1-acyl-sn-glycerol-3-phosphate acyltransferase [Bacteroidales bacterium]
MEKHADYRSNLYNGFKAYVRFVLEKIYYRRTYVKGIENLPAPGTPVLITSNHQNALNDALGVLMAINDRKPRFIVRGDAFALGGGSFGKFLRTIGLLPAYRMSHDGEGALAGNDKTFKVSEQALIEGGTVLIFPEAGHSEGHWLSNFKSGFTKMAFGAAELGDFEKDILILPACNHYSTYFGIRGELYVEFGKPISLKQYYDLYKEKPRTAQREVSHLVREKIQEMMLDVRDKEHYHEIEWIRKSDFGDLYAKTKGFNPENLGEKLQADRLLVSALEEAEKAENPYYVPVVTDEGPSADDLIAISLEKQEQKRAAVGGEPRKGPVQDMFNLVKEYRNSMKTAGIRDVQFGFNPTKGDLAIRLVCLAILAPLAFYCLWPSVICYFLPLYFAKKMKGRLFDGTFLLAVNLLVLFPILGLVTFFWSWHTTSLLWGVLHTALIPMIILFEWAYFKWVKEAVRDIRWFKLMQTGEIERLRSLRNDIYTRLRQIVKI